jgi:tRNA(fMet)-specific endonuclease VapC
VAVVVPDSSVWIDSLAGRTTDQLSLAMDRGAVILSPLVVVELISGARSEQDLAIIGSLLQDLPVHPTPLAHWLAVGHLRRRLAESGIAVSIADAHIAQCALDLDALLLTRDKIFTRVARVSALCLLSA